MHMKRAFTVAALVVALIVVLLPPMMSGAVPPVACNFWGTVKLNGLNVPDNTVVSIWSSDWTTQWRQTTTFTYQSESYYNIDVNGDDPETGDKEGPAQGETVRFKISGNNANESSTWAEAGSKQVNLTAAGATPTASHTPTRTLTPSITPTGTQTPQITATLTPTAIPRVAVFQQELLPTAGYEGCEDTYITTYTPYDTHDNEGLWVYTQLSHRSLVKFDLDVAEGVPTGSTVQSAFLELYSASRTHAYDMDVRAFQMKTEWAETEATWYNRLAGESWGMPGAEGYDDRELTPLATTRVTDVDQKIRLDVTAAVQDWVMVPTENHGVLLTGGLVGQTTAYAFWFSEYGPSPSRRPKLEVTYLAVPPTATPTLTPSTTPTRPTSTPTMTLTPSPTQSTGRIQGIVYVDANRDEQWNTGEPGVPGATVELRSATNQLLDSRVTGSGGTYLFDFLYTATYKVQVDFPLGYTPFSPDPPSVSITVGPGTDRRQDFGAIAQSHILDLPLVLMGAT